MGSVNAPRENGAGPHAVAPKLRNELVSTGERPGFSQTLNKVDPHTRTVEVDIRVEQVHLEGPREIAKRGSRAEVHHTPEFADRRLRLDRVHTIRGKQLARRRRFEVDGRESQCAPPLLSPSDARLH